MAIIGKDHNGKNIGYCDEDKKKSCKDCGKCVGETDHPKTNKALIQVSFAGNADLVKIKDQLKQLVQESKEKYSEVQFAHLFLPRHIVEEKGFSTDIVDLLDEVLGDNQYNPIADSINFNDYMSKLENARFELATMTDSIAVLGVEVAEGVIKEIYAKTSSVIFVKQQDKKVI